MLLPQEDDVACVVHGDDFTFEGPWRSLQKLPDELRQFWLIKVRGVLRPDPSDDKEVSILNRVMWWTPEGVEYEADSRHVEKLLRDMGLESCKPISTLGVKSSGDEKEGDVELLDSATQTLFRVCVGGGGQLVATI